MKHLTTILDKVATELEARGLKKLAAEIDVVANTLEKKSYGITMATPLEYTLYTDKKTGVTHTLSVDNTDDDSYVQSHLQKLLSKLPYYAEQLAKSLLGYESDSVPDIQRGGNTSQNVFFVEDKDLRDALGNVHKDLKSLGKTDVSRETFLKKKDLSPILNPIMDLNNIYNDDRTNRHFFIHSGWDFIVKPLKEGLKDLALLEEVYGNRG